MTRTLHQPKTETVLSDPALKGVLPRPFFYGCASASYQIEGAIDADGKGPCVWDECLRNQDNGDLACDSYHQWEKDIELLKQYGCNTYRFSISWPRVIPLGPQSRVPNDSQS